MRRTSVSLLFVAALVAVPDNVVAAPTSVTLSGSVTSSCVLAVSTTGVLVADAAGTSMRSDSGTGARAALMTIAATGTNPTLTFSAPTMTTAPSGFTADSVQFSYTVTGSGASRGFAATGATASARLIDTATINGLVQSASGFPTGSYTETIDVTCS